MTMAKGTSKPPIDVLYDLMGSEFIYSPEQQGWISKIHSSKLPFDELIYSWNVHLPEGEGFRLYLKVYYNKLNASDWLYAGYWGTVNLQSNREKPQFKEGILDLDQLLLKRKAVAFQFKTVSDGEKPLTVQPSLHVLFTNNHPTPAEFRKHKTPQVPVTPHPETILDLPLRKQDNAQGQPIPDRCQSAALATAMEYFGKPVTLDEIIPLNTDPEYNSYGIWPRTIQAAIDLGFEAYIDRFRNWDAVRRAVQKNKVLLCSITMPRNDSYISPPYAQMEGHIVALNGVTDDGRVIITDSAMRDEGARVQWKIEDFQKIWMRNKGGVAMVICPPKDAVMKTVSELPPFPKRDYKTIKK